MKKYILKLYETEVVFLYRILKRNKPHLARLESQIDEIIENNSEFNFWKDFLKGEK